MRRIVAVVGGVLALLAMPLVVPVALGMALWDRLDRFVKDAFAP